MPRSPRPPRRAPLPALLLSALLLPAVLSACTGTDDTPLPIRLNVLTDGGATLRALSPQGDAAGAVNTTSVVAGVQVAPLPGGRRFVLVRADGAESRDADGRTPQPYPAPGFSPVCFTRAAQNAARDRLLLLSDCGGTQRLALYRGDALVWTALLPTFLNPTPGSDTPPVRLAVQGDVGLVTRPRIGGGSEVLRVAIPDGSSRAEVSPPLNIPATYDLAPYGTDILAATDAGIQKLTPTGAPDPATTLNAFGAVRYDRLWTGPSSQLAAWRSNVLAGTSGSPLRLWNGSATTAATVDTISDLRDLTLPPDGYLYALSGAALTRYDTLRGLQNGTWVPTTLQSGLNDPRSVTWTVPPATP